MAGCAVLGQQPEGRARRAGARRISSRSNASAPSRAAAAAGDPRGFRPGRNGRTGSSRPSRGTGHHGRPACRRICGQRDAAVSARHRARRPGGCRPGARAAPPRASLQARALAWHGGDVGAVTSARRRSSASGPSRRTVPDGLEREQLERPLGCRPAGARRYPAAGRDRSSAGGAYCSSRPRSMTPMRSPRQDGLGHVMRHQHDRDAEPPLQRRRGPVLRLGADDGIEGAERLVHEEQLRFRRQRPRHADPLLLAAGELVREFAGVERRGRGRTGRGARLTRRATRAAVPPHQRRHGGDVAGDRPVREQAVALDERSRCRAAAPRPGWRRCRGRRSGSVPAESAG